MNDRFSTARNLPERPNYFELAQSNYLNALRARVTVHEEVERIKREELSKCVRLIGLAHAKGLVETIEGLPTPEKILYLEEKDLNALLMYIPRKYFSIDELSLR